MRVYKSQKKKKVVGSGRVKGGHRAISGHVVQRISLKKEKEIEMNYTVWLPKKKKKRSHTQYSQIDRERERCVRVYRAREQM